MGVGVGEREREREKERDEEATSIIRKMRILPQGVFQRCVKTIFGSQLLNFPTRDAAMLRWILTNFFTGKYLCYLGIQFSKR
jgi:hypothetical protein